MFYVLDLCRFSLEILFGLQQGGGIVSDVPAFVMLCSLVRPAVSLSTRQTPAVLPHSRKTLSPGQAAISSEPHSRAGGQTVRTTSVPQTNRPPILPQKKTAASAAV